MRHLQCDVAIIGAGTAGLGAWSAATACGAKPIIIEGGVGGTTCARVGCMPSKLLIEAAKVAHAQRNAAFVGIASVEPQIDGKAVMRRVQKERDYFTSGVFEKFDSIPEDQRVRGYARFLSATRLAVGDHTEIEAQSIVIATGSSTSLPAMFEPVKDLVLTNETIFEIEDLPRSFAVVGAGAVGLELAQAFARLGVRVKLFDKAERLGGLDDPEVNAEAVAILGKELDLVLGAEISIDRVGDAARVSWGRDDKSAESFDRILAAAGRPPNLKALTLEATGLALDEHGVPEFDENTMRCGDSSIYIAGDASAFRPVLHEASYSAKMAGRGAASDIDKPKKRGCAFAVTFSDPEIAVVGPKFATLAQAEVAIGEAKFSSNGRARIEGYEAGKIRVYAQKSDARLIGGQMVGPGAEHLAHLLTWLCELGVKAQDATALPFYHPTVEETLRAALRSVCNELGVTPRERQPCFGDPPGC